MVSYSIVINNENGNIWIPKGSEIGLNLNAKDWTNAISLAKGGTKTQRGVGRGVSLNFGSIKGLKREKYDTDELYGLAIDEVIMGASVGLMACNVACVGAMTTGTNTIFTYGVGSSQIGMTGGKMQRLPPEKQRDLLRLLGIKK